MRVTSRLREALTRVDNCALWFLKLSHSEAKEQVIFNVNILGGSSSVLELLGTIGNSALEQNPHLHLGHVKSL